jgi:hypothetical protein
MNTEKLEQPSSAERSETNRPYFSLSDLFFMVIAGALGIGIVQLGYATWIDGRHTESAKSTGESIVSWMTDAASKRSPTGDGSANECSGEEKNWLDCREWLVSSSGPFRGLSNQINPSNKLFSPACDRTQLNTLGSIIFEKGTPKPPDGASLIYAPLADDEPLGGPLSLRLSICGRGFSVIHVAEFTF